MEERYDAFISYNHAADGELAPAIERGLQRLAKPWYKLRALSVFRDLSDTGLNPSLWGTVQRKLDDSRWFVLLACPESAASEWVAREVAYWSDSKGIDRILLVVTGGDLVWDRVAGTFDPALTTAVTPDLARRFSSEPLHLDLRWARDLDPPVTLADTRFRSEMARLASPIRDLPPDEIESEDIRLYRTARRLARGAVAALVTLTIIASVAAILAVRNANEAERRAREATARQLGLLALDMPASELDRALLVSVAAAGLDPDGGVERFRPTSTLLGRHARLTAMLHVPAELDRPSLRGVAISPDGGSVAATVWPADGAPQVVGWEVEGGGATVAPLPPASGPAIALVDGGSPLTFSVGTIAADTAVRRAIVADGEQTALIDPADGGVLASWPIEVRAAAVTGDRAGVASRTWLELVDARSGASIAASELTAAPVVVAVRDDTVVTATERGELTWWEREGERLDPSGSSVPVASVGRPTQLVLDATGRRALVAGDGGTAVVDGVAERVLAVDAHVGAVAADPSGRWVAVGGSRITVWDLDDGRRAVAVAEEVSAMAWSGCRDPRPCRLVTAGEAIVVWEPATGRRVELADQTNAQAVDITDDGETIVSGGWGSSVAVWGMTAPIDDSARQQITPEGPAAAYDPAGGAVARSVDGGAVVVSTGSGADADARRVDTGPVDAMWLFAGATRLLVEHGGDVRLFDVAGGTPIPLACEGEIWAVSPAGRRLVAYDPADDMAMICETGDGTRIDARPITGASATAVAVDDEGGIALGGRGLVGYFAVRDGRIQPGVSVDVRFGGESVGIGSIALRGGRLAAAVDPSSGTGPSRVVIWDAVERGIAVQFETDHPELAAVALLGEDAGLLAVAGRALDDGDVVVQVWESDTRRRLGRGLGGLRGDVIALGGDESEVVGTDAAGRTYRWRLDRDPGREVCQIVGRDLSQEEWADLTTYRYEPVCG